MKDLKEFDENYLNAVRKKLSKRGLGDDEIESFINKMKGFEEAEVREKGFEINQDNVEKVIGNVIDKLEKIPKEPTVKLRFCEFCDAKGPISHKKSCTRVK